jgi:malonyl-CoA/methylmalonyl-CoA synthetase
MCCCWWFGIAKLIGAYESMSSEQQQQCRQSCERLRLMVSGSSALPVSVMHQWERITSHRLLERYGMSEIGMALSNTIEPPRVPGSVGLPLPGVQVRIVATDDTGREQQVTGESSSGELRIKGASVFKEYVHCSSLCLCLKQYKRVWIDQSICMALGI